MRRTFFMDDNHRSVLTWCGRVMLALTVIGLVLCFCVGCASAPMYKPAPSLTGITAAVSAAETHTRDALTLAQRIEADGTAAHSDEAKALVEAVRSASAAHLTAFTEVGAADGQVKKLAAERDTLAVENEALKKAGNKVALIAYAACGFLFVAGYFVSKLCFKAVEFSGWWGAILSIVTRIIPLDVAVGIGCVIAGFVLLKFTLPILMHWGWLLRLIF